MGDNRISGALSPRVLKNENFEIITAVRTMAHRGSLSGVVSAMTDARPAALKSNLTIAKISPSNGNVDFAGMNLQCSCELASRYKSGSQIARVLTEDWCVRELYCPACTSDRLSPSKANTPAIDFVCPECNQLFQLKSLRNGNPRKIVDAGYDSMLRSIRADKIPNLLVLHYSPDWLVRNLLLVPRFFFSESAIEKRKPLGPLARRAAWVGCNILLAQIPIDGKIAMVSDGLPVPKRRVRDEFAHTRSLAKVPPLLRGWTLDVLNIARRLGRARFTLKDLYQFEAELQASHPGNHNIRPKIRQQLQVLRDLGLAEFIGRGEYALRPAM